MKYILYCRKSTDSEDKQVLSLDSQEKELLDIASKSNLNVIKTFKESRTAKEAGRPIFNEVIQMIANGKADAILCWKLDRLARNFLDGGLIMDMLQKGVIKEIRTYESTHLPNETAFIMAMQFGMANQFSRDLSVNVKRGNRACLEKGGWPNKAPFGYLNDKGNRAILIDHVRAKHVVKAFELYAMGTYSFKDISGQLFKEGLRTIAGTKVYSSHIHRFADNPFYCGLMKRDGKYYPGNHEPIISKELFERVQQVIHNKNRPRTKTLFFPLRGFLTCENCGCALTASLKKGHQYYYCTNGKGICTEHKSYMRETLLHEIVAGLLQSLHFSEEHIKLVYEAAKEKVNANLTYVTAALSTLEKRLESLTAKEKRLLDTFLDQQISKEIYDAKVLEIQNDRVSLQGQINDLKSKQPVFTLEPTRDVFIQASRARSEFMDGDDAKKRNIVSSLLWNLSIKNKSVAQVSFKSPYDILAKEHDNDDILQLRRRWDSNPR
ncbi:MAG: recombinase family protein, partial [bacterium]|nr:recombinase family protein [bacterium]